MVVRNFSWPSINRPCLLALCAGILAGFSFTYLLFTNNMTLQLYSLSDPHYSHEMAHLHGPDIDPGRHDHDEEFHRDEDSSVADQMRREVRVLCWIMTNPKNHDSKAKHVRNTWGKRCNVLLFMSSQEDNSLPSVALPVKEGRDYLWAKTKEAFKYIHANYLDRADWFLKADDDTYVILENLRYMLYPYKATDPIYFGCKFKPYVQQGYMSGGAGYVLSRESVKRFVEMGLTNDTICSASHDGNEDVEIGKCLQNVKVKAGDSRDSLGRGRFFPFVPEHHLIPGHMDKDFWYHKYMFYENKQGMECCSDNAVSFHYVSPNHMYVLEYLVYHLRPYGITYRVKVPGGTTDNKDVLSGYPEQTKVMQSKSIGP